MNILAVVRLQKVWLFYKIESFAPNLENGQVAILAITSNQEKSSNQQFPILETRLFKSKYAKTQKRG